MKFNIEYLNKKFSTIHFENISDAECDEIRVKFAIKTNINNVIKEIKSLYFRNGIKISNIYDYFFYDLMCDCRLIGHKWTINEFMLSNDLIRFAVGKIKNNNKFYPEDKDIIYNIKTLFRLSPSGTAAKLSNFPYKTINDILKKYNVNNNYYDFSCGWGVRLTAALSNNVNYFGTDPNKKLCDRLYQLTDLYKSVTTNNSTVDIRCHGSEIKIIEWHNKIGLAFSSPPYYNLEEYSISDDSNQSIKNRNYDKWLNEFVIPTIDNIKYYLIDSGFLMYNIKNTKHYNMYDDIKDIISNNGFVLIDELDLKNITRHILKQNNKSTDEKIMVFKKI